jgi:hypothetical protein
MTAEILDFSSSINRRLERSEQQEKWQKQQREREIGRLRMIQMTAGTKPLLKFRDEDDYKIAARANRELWLRARDRGVRLRDVQESFPKAHRYMISDTSFSAPEQDQKLEKKLSGPVQKYLELAKVIALAGGMDPDDAMISVLRETSIWTKSPREAEGIDERCQYLAELLQQTAARITRRKALSNLLARAQKIPGIWDMHRRSLSRSDMAALTQSGYEGWYEHWTEVPPLPSVPLIRLPLGTVTTTALVGRETVTDDVVSACLAPEVGWFGSAKKGAPEPLDYEGDLRKATVAVHREIRLAIGPTTSGDNTGAMFESRTVIRAAIEHLGTDLPLWPSCDIGMATRPGGSLIGVGKEWRRITLPRFWEDAEEAVSDTFYLLATDPLRDPKGSEFEHWYVSWTPVDAAHVSHWLDRPIFGAECIAREAPPRRRSGTMWFSSNRLAFHIEQDLLDGSLETDLEREVDVICKELERRKTEWRAAALASTEALIGELSSDIDENEEKDQ